jgi:hypothetical protein
LNIGLRAVTLLSFSLIVCSAAVPTRARAQAIPAATQPIHLSGFGGLTGAYTGLQSSRNLGITAGFDVGFKPLFRLYPSAEIRGTYPVDSGTVAGERNFLAGLKVERPYRALHPYGDFLFGRNKIEYGSGGYPNSSFTLLYVSSVANVLALGGGVDIDMTPHFAAKFDAQYERYGAPVTPSGDLNSVAFTAGIVYRIDFNHHFRYDRKTDQVTNLPKEPAPKTPLPPPPPPVPPDAAPDAAPTPDAPPQPAATPDTTTPAPTPAPDPSAAPTQPAPQPQ